MRTKEDFNKQNEYNRNQYDRIGLMLPKGIGDQWKTEAKRRNISLNAMVQQAVAYYIEHFSEEGEKSK